MKKYIVGILGIASFFMSGCTYTTYEFAEPRSQQGKSCVNDCAYQQTMCKANEDRENQRLRMRYDREQKLYNRCLENTNHDYKRCISPSYETARGFNCDEVYRACYKACGGQVIAVEKEM